MSANAYIYQHKKICYELSGQGRTVVFVHGFAEDRSVWEQQCAFLSSYFRLLLIDLPGSGQSDFVPDATIDTYGDIVLSILDKEAPGETVTIIGHSMGGYVTLSIAAKAPARLNGLVLFHSSALADTEEKKQSRRKSIAFIRSNGAAAFLKTATPGLFGETFITEHPEAIQALVDHQHYFSADALIQYYEAMISRPDRTNVLQTFGKPILFILGEEDKALPLHTGLQQCYLPAESHIHFLQKSGHMGMWEEPETANRLLLDFLNRLSF